MDYPRRYGSPERLKDKIIAMPSDQLNELQILHFLQKKFYLEDLARQVRTSPTSNLTRAAHTDVCQKLTLSSLSGSDLIERGLDRITITDELEVALDVFFKIEKYQKEFLSRSPH